MWLSGRLVNSHDVVKRSRRQCCGLVAWLPYRDVAIYSPGNLVVMVARWPGGDVTKRSPL